MSSTYIKWILVAIAVAVGVWVVARPSGKNKPGGGGGNAGGANASATATDERPGTEASPAQPVQSAPPQPAAGSPPATVRSAPHPVPRPEAPPRVDGDHAGPGNGYASGSGGSGLTRADEPIASSLGLWGDGYAEGVRDRWRDLQLRFIDDPQSVAGEAQEVVDEAVAALTASVNARKDELGTWRSGRGDDTEELRAAVNRYREFLDRLLRV